MLELPKDVSDLITYDAKTGAVSSRESRHLEFKQGFTEADFSDYTKVLASFCNTDGGVIVFGVSDKPRMIVGSNPIPDEAKWTDRLRADFDPEISFSVREYKVFGKTVYAVGVDPIAHKPVVCKKSRSKAIEVKKEKKDVSITQEAMIYYRYSGQTKIIGYSELHNMLAEREAQYLRKMLETLHVIQKVGLDNAGIVDVSAPKSAIYMSKETAKGLSFIDKAKLVEDDGAPAYVVTGNVDLHQVVHAPLEDADKNIPSEVANILTPLIYKAFGTKSFAPSNVTKLLKHLKIDGDDVHCVHEKKLNRKYVTRKGIAALQEFITRKPAEAINVFGSRSAKHRYGLESLREKGIHTAHDIFPPVPNAEHAAIEITVPIAEEAQKSE